MPGHRVDSLRLDDLKFGTLLGEGAFARVLLARDARNGAEYAVKILEKKSIQVHDRKHSVLSEKSMLSSLDHPGIVKLIFAFQDDWSLYFGLELIQGGELASQIARMGVCSIDFAQFYAAEIVSILSYLRIRRVAHRDVKPENLLLTLEGHLKLVDFDAAVFVPDEADKDASCQYHGQPSFAGTSLYLPPEVITGTAQPEMAFALDLWALGCIIFLMLVGKTPFHAETQYLAFQRIQNGDYVFPNFGFVYYGARDLIASLLSADPRRRPGLSEGLVELERDAFFGGSQASFAEIRRKQPPPRIRSDRYDARCLDTSCCTDFTSSAFDFASSAECTPEVGQCFLNPKAMQVSVAPATLSPMSQLSSRTEEGSPRFMMSIESGASAMQSLSPRADSCPRQLQLHSKGIPASRRIPAMPASHIERSNARLLPECPAALPTVAHIDARALALKLLRLRANEVVLMHGPILRRRLPCLRPKVLVLTSRPRLVVLNSSGQSVLRDIRRDEVEADEVLRCCWQGRSLNCKDPLIQVKSSADFEICGKGFRLRCSDDVVGAQEWAMKINSVWASPCGIASSASHQSLCDGLRI